jgi:DNA-binding transcriptional MocR family regulator
MYRFFMEQHTEKIIQQYAERNQRATQVISDYFKFNMNVKA